jgi:pimeloyl-ACP methyl ester carboxylesterase
VRIERYDAPGEPSRFVVYIGPTETFSPVATDEPWDLTSNVTGVAGLDAGSLRATELAMHDAGIRPGHEVQFVGFSQGGLVATRLAASGDWNAAGLETYGAPAGGIVLPDGLSGMAVRNTDDFIPALAGPQLDHHLLQVERRAFAEGSPIPVTEPAPAHQREAYVATATVVDAARSAAVREQVAAMDAFASGYAEREGSSITVTTYHAERGGAKSLAATSSSGGSIP